MLRTVYLVVRIALFLIGTLIRRPAIRRLQRAGDDAGVAKIIEGIAAAWAAGILRWSGASVEFDGLENLPPDGAPVVYVANHQSFMDIPLITAALRRPARFIAKEGVRKIPIIRGLVEAWPCVLVDRGNASAAAAAFREAEKIVERGDSLIVYAEGTRSRTGEMLPFKAGSFRIAQRAKVPVVPCCIEGTGRFLEQNGYRIDRKSVLRLRVLPVIDTSAYTRDNWKALPALCEEQIAGALAEMREKASI